VPFLILGVILGQKIWSDGVTFFKSGDQFLLCFPDFQKIVQYVSNGIFSGVDTGTFNGASEFFARANLPNRYAPIFLFAWLVQFVDSSVAYYLFLYFQLFLLCYFSQKTAVRFFNMTWESSCLVMMGSVCVALLELWYLSFFIVVTLIFPLLYFGLCSLELGKLKIYLASALFYFLALTSGYITLSVVLFVSVFFFLAIYAWDAWKEETLKGRKQILARLLLPPLMGGMAGLPYCYLLLDYNKEVVSNEVASNMFNALYYRVSLTNLPKFLFSSFNLSAATEQEELYGCIGLVWFVLMVCVIIYRNVIKEKASRTFRLFAVSLVVFGVVYAWSLGPLTPVGYWMYSFLPVLGTMHLPQRYWMVVLPLLFLTLMGCAAHVPNQGKKSFYKIAGIISMATTVVVCILGGDRLEAKFNIQQLILELLIAAVFFLCVYSYGLKDKKTIFAMCVGVSWYFIAFFYNINQASVYSASINASTIVYNSSVSEALDNYIGDNIENKSLYKFDSINSTGAVPMFIPSNYQWFNISDYTLCCYTGYEPQLSMPKAYREKFPIFNKVDWQYMLDTRADFIFVDDGTIEQNRDLFDKIIDWEKSTLYLRQDIRICKLKRFIPSFLAGESYVPEEKNSLDNGYFFSAELTGQQMVEFHTDNATYYSAVFDADQEANVVFLLYPNRFYHYYVDGEEVSPNIDNMVSWLSLNKGRHTVDIRYKNGMEQFSNVIMAFFIAIVALGEVACAVFDIIKGKTRKAEK